MTAESLGTAKWSEKILLSIANLRLTKIRYSDI
jgi:hypothetical protein